MAIRKRTWTSKGKKKQAKKQAWIVDYYATSPRTGERSRIVKQFKTEEEAKDFDAQTHVEKKQGMHVAASDNLTVREAAELWMDYIENDPDKQRERTTVDQYRQHVDLHINPLLGNVNLSKLTKPVIDKFTRSLLDRPSARSNGQKISRATARKILTSYKSLLKYAMACGYAVPSPAMAAKVSTLAREQRNLEIGKDIPSTDEIREILDNAAGRWRPLILTACFSGMRSSELRGLRWENVDFDNRQIRVCERADSHNQIGPPKSRSGNRVIPLPPMVLNTLKEWKLKCPRQDGELAYVFPNGVGNIESHANILQRGFWPAQIAAGAVDRSGNPKYGLHGLRHWYASWLINRKANGGLELPAKTVQVRLGHANVGITLNTYSHLFPDGDDHHDELAAAELAIVG